MTLASSVPLGYAIANTIIRRSLRHVSPLELTLVSLASAGALLLPAAFFTVPPTTANQADFPAAVACLAILGIVGTGLAMYLFNKLIHEQGPLFAGMVTNLSPVGALLWGWVDRERVTPMQVIALAGLVAMVTIVQFGAAVAPARAAHEPAE
jgi:drug/metabolite transporter (DMT)-like permease